MTLLSTDDLVKAGVITNVDATILQMLLDSAEEEIDARRGPAGVDVTEAHPGRLRLIGLFRPAATVQTVTELDGVGVSTLLDATDWLIYPDQRHLFRIPWGTHQTTRWSAWVQITFTPRDDVDERKRVQLALVKLDLAYNGWAAQATQNESRSALANYHLERAAILASFALTESRSF